MILDKEDNMLASALAHDDREVFNRLFEKLYPKVKYFITGMCHDEVGGDTDPQREVEYKELIEKVREMIDHMPLQRRKVFMMSREDGLSNREIAERLGISQRTVETHISMSLKELRKLMPLLFLLGFCR